MTPEQILGTVAELGTEHALLTIHGCDGVQVVRCNACGHAVVVGT